MTTPLRFEAIGTAWEVVTDLPLPPPVAAAVGDTLDRFDRTWSRFRDDSAVSAVAATGGVLPLEPATEALIDLYERLGRLTDHAVSPLVGGSLAALGYDAQYSLQAGTPVAAPGPETLSRAPGELRVAGPATVDVGAAGKGLAVDLVVTVLREHGIRPRWVDASGDLWYGGPERAARVALEDPHDPARAVGVVPLGPGRALAASAVNRRAWGDGLHHVLDARTGLPADEIVATWAIADTAMLADGAATALFFASAEEVASALGVVAVRMSGRRVVEVGGAFEGEIFTA